MFKSAETAHGRVHFFSNVGSRAPNSGNLTPNTQKQFLYTNPSFLRTCLIRSNPVAQFPDTLWSELIELGGAADEVRRKELLESLVSRYWKPVYHFVRAREEKQVAEDLTQQFFTMLLARGDLAKVSKDRGSFRGFLRTALRHFLISANRGQMVARHSFAFEEADLEWQRDPGTDPEAAFDRAWARTVLSRAVADLEQQLRDEGRDVHLAVFQAYCLDDGELSYREIGATHGISENDVRNRLREARIRLRKILRSSLREYLGDGETVEDELRFILQA